MGRWDDTEGWRDDAGLGDVAPNPDYATAVPHTRRPGRAGQFTPRWTNEGVPEPAAPPPTTGTPPQRVRTVVPINPFWTNMPVPFTGVANQQVTAFSKPIDFDAVFNGAWTDLVSARVLFSQTRTRRDWSIEHTPLLSQAGASDKVQPIRWWKQPTFIGAQSVMKGDFLNIGAEGAGRVVFMTHAYQSPDQQIRVIVKESMSYWLNIDLGAAALIGFTAPIDDALLVWGASTNVANDLLIQLTDERSNYAWSSDQVPARAFAGVDSEVQPIVMYPRPYYLPPRARFRANYSAAVAGNYFTFVCERLLRHEIEKGGAPRRGAQEAKK